VGLSDGIGGSRSAISLYSALVNGRGLSMPRGQSVIGTGIVHIYEERRYEVIREEGKIGAKRL